MSSAAAQRQADGSQAMFSGRVAPRVVTPTPRRGLRTPAINSRIDNQKGSNISMNAPSQEVRELLVLHNYR